MGRLLILACTARKRSDPGLLPAIERYDGPTFRVLRHYMRAVSVDVPHILVLSAKYSLISADTHIPAYDHRMTRARALALRPTVRTGIGELVGEEAIRNTSFSDVAICAGETYLEAFGPIDELPFSCPVATLTGTVGKQLATLYDWLRSGLPHTELKSVRKAPANGPVTFRGMGVTLSEETVLDLAQKQASVDPGGAASYEAWYVQAGSTRVAPKWLLSLLTGIPVGKFRTADARRVLAQLGVEVRRI